MGRKSAITQEQFEQMERLAKSFGAIVEDGILTFHSENRFGSTDNRELFKKASGPLGMLYGWTLRERHLAERLRLRDEAHRRDTEFLREALRKARCAVTAFGKKVAA